MPPPSSNAECRARSPGSRRISTTVASRLAPTPRPSVCSVVPPIVCRRHVGLRVQSPNGEAHQHARFRPRRQPLRARRKLGAGAMGDVYRAFDRGSGREVALKLLRQASGRDLYRFKREFRALADIDPPEPGRAARAASRRRATGSSRWSSSTARARSSTGCARPPPGTPIASPRSTRRGCARARPARRRADRAARRAASCTATSSRRTCSSTRDGPRRAARLRAGRRARRRRGADPEPTRRSARPCTWRPSRRAGQPLAAATRLVRGRRDALRGAHRRGARSRATREEMLRAQAEREPPPPRALGADVPRRSRRGCACSSCAPTPGSRARRGARSLAALGARRRARRRARARAARRRAFVGPRRASSSELRRALADARRARPRRVLVAASRASARRTLVAPLPRASSATTACRPRGPLLRARGGAVQGARRRRRRADRALLAPARATQAA